MINAAAIRIGLEVATDGRSSIVDLAASLTVQIDAGNPGRFAL